MSEQDEGLPPLSSLVGSMPGWRSQMAAEREAELREQGFVPVAEVDRLRADLADAKAEAAREIAEAIEAEPDFYQKSYWAGINRGALIARGIAVGYARALSAGGGDPTGDNGGEVADPLTSAIEANVDRYWQERRAEATGGTDPTGDKR